MNLVDRALQPGGKLNGYSANKVTSKSLNAAVNLDNPAAYAKPGAAPNGADYVQLKKDGSVLTGSALQLGHLRRSRESRAAAAEVDVGDHGARAPGPDPLVRATRRTSTQRPSPR